MKVGGSPYADSVVVATSDDTNIQGGDDHALNISGAVMQLEARTAEEDSVESLQTANPTPTTASRPCHI